MFDGVYEGRKVLVTGHTGFKGSWLTAWLLDLGADVAGFSLDIPSQPSNFEVLGLEDRIQHFQGDIRDLAALREAFESYRPEIVIHLAAQALVRKSFDDPVTTFATNTLGTVHVLESVRHAPSVRAGVMITSDKCYRNVEWPWGYRETDVLGGEDPYSGSKGAAELAFYSYFHSYFADPQSRARIATARAGNVIGGGDWATDRILPDCVRAWSKGEAVRLRNPGATRPWQHVLEPLSGYLWLGAQLFSGRLESERAESFNFGPRPDVDEPVLRLVESVKAHWPEADWTVTGEEQAAQKEATLLKLACDKALHRLRWHAVLTFEETVALTAAWYGHYYGENSEEMYDFTLGQIGDYCQKGEERGLPWAKG